mmetsp:Transcript_14289/g.21327  ORF Transcript_14289/g.21327 Transcript_14289/m.21327 type:complete len:89 (-) Transcript_14289:461-727(-)
MTMDIPYIPALIGTAAIVFAVFNIENPVDLTDSGRAKAKAKRRAERIARGEVLKPKEGLDPYRFRIFEEDDDDNIDMIGGGKKSGGCG